jgi:hypothetical protein
MPILMQNGVVEVHLGDYQRSTTRTSCESMLIYGIMTLWHYASKDALSFVSVLSVLRDTDLLRAGTNGSCCNSGDTGIPSLDGCLSKRSAATFSL